MNARPYILAETNWKNVKKEKFEVVILPWGATEAHNYHLPYATDNFQCEFVAADSARKAWEKGAKVIVLPCIPFGVNTGQQDITLDINLYPSTQFAILKDVIEVLTRQNIPKLIIMNGHGGNDFKQMIRELQAMYPSVFICTMHWYKVLDWKKYFKEPGDHAGAMETSAMLHIAPELVLPLSEAGEGEEKKFKIEGLREGWVWAQREWSKISKDTGVGNPQGSTADEGKIYLEDTTSAIASFIVDLAKADKNDLYD